MYTIFRLRLYSPNHIESSLQLADNTPGAPAVIDWDTTLAYRHELWSYGLGVADAMDPETNAATARVLRQNGCEVVVPREQACCGAIHYHSGYEAPALGLMRANLKAIEEVLKLEAQPDAKFPPALQKVKAEWDTWREGIAAHAKAKGALFIVSFDPMLPSIHSM